MECFKDRTLSNASAIYDTKARPMTVKECSATCVRNLDCQGIQLQPTTPTGSQTYSYEMAVGSCSLFFLNTTLTAAHMTDEPGSKVCRHINRDSMI